MLKTIFYNPDIRGFNPELDFFFANTSFSPGENKVTESTFNHITAHPLWNDFVNDGTFTTPDPVVVTEPSFSSPWTGKAAAVDNSQVSQNTADIQALEADLISANNDLASLQASQHPAVTAADLSLINSNQALSVNIDGVTPGNTLQLTAEGLYVPTSSVTSRFTWAWTAGRNARLSTPSFLRTVNGIPSNQAPFIGYEDSQIRRVIVQNDPSDIVSSWEAVIISTGIEVYSLIKPAGQHIEVSPRIAITISELDEVSIFFRNATTAVNKPNVQLILTEF